MTNNLKYLLVVLFFAEILCSCVRSSVLKDKNYILWKNDFRGNNRVLEEDLSNIIPFSLKENSKPLNLPITPKVWWYNYGLANFDAKKNQEKLNEVKAEIELEKQKGEAQSNRILSKLQKKQTRYIENQQSGLTWFWRNIGEKQVYIDEPKVKETSQKMRKYLFDIGFRDAEVNYKIDTISSSHKVKVHYIVHENQPYTIDSISYKIQDFEIYKIIQENKNSPFVSVGKNFDLRMIDLEKIRIETLLKNEGYYQFISKYIKVSATNKTGSEAQFLKDKHGILQIEILNPDNKDKHERFTVEEVVFRAFDQNATNSLTVLDTTFYRGIKFLQVDHQIPLKLVGNRILSLPKNLYKINDIYETQKQIGRFNQFAFASSQINIAAPNKLSVQYFAPLLEKYTFGISPGVNNMYSEGSTFFGFGVPISLTARNLFKQFEIIEGSIRASYEGQPTPLGENGKLIRGSKELGFNLNVTMPNLLFFRYTNSGINLKNPRTIFSGGYNYSEPFWGKRLNFKLKVNYSIQLNNHAFLYFAPLDVSLVNTVYFNNQAGQDFYNALVELEKQGNNLKVTYDPQFVSSINSTFIYNTQNPAKSYDNSTYFRLFVESGGTFQNFAKNKDRIDFIENVFPLPENQNSSESQRAYFRFAKVNADFRKNIGLTKSSSYAYRLNLGFTNPYGKNHSLPYDKNFFIGGSNSVRAWAPRTLGTGSAKPDTTASGNTIPQPGDIIVESSLEYRVKTARFFGGDIQLAAFIDAGNIWKWHPNSTKVADDAQFKFNKFYKEIAVGTGLGLRWDLSYFLFRFDWGIKVFDPSRNPGDRFVLDEFTLRRKHYYGLNWNFGIGLPF